MANNSIDIICGMHVCYAVYDIECIMWRVYTVFVDKRGALFYFPQVVLLAHCLQYWI